MGFQTAKTSFLRFVKSIDFSRGYILALAMVIPIALTNYLQFSSVGIGMAIGVLLCAPSDVPGNLRHRFLGMLTAIFFSIFATLVGGYAVNIVALRLPVLVVLVFCMAYISVYGFRASLVSFTGLLATVLSFANLGTESLWLHTLYIGAGGIWYLFISTLFLWLRPQKHVEQLLGETAKLTADFLVLRSKLLIQKQNRQKLQEEQFNLQTTINEHHENLREALLSFRKASGVSNSSRRKLLIFIDLVDVLELGIAHPVNFEKVDELYKTHPHIVNQYKQLVITMSERLVHISEAFIDGKRLNINFHTQQIIKEIETSISDFFEKESYPESRSTLLLLRNVLDFEKKQHQKIQAIERVLGNIADRNRLTVKNKAIKQFLTPTDYSFKILQENFSFSSPILRHAARLSTLMVLGVVVGEFFQLQNVYWILLTLAVIMRPGFGLTKERSKKRIIGTLIGGAVAVLIVLSIQNTVVYAVLSIISLILAFSMLQKNYVGAAAFITLNVVFIYALLKPDALSVIQYRVIDTVIGAGLAFLGNLLLWPSWEYKEVHKHVIAALKENKAYLQQIDLYYHTKGKLPTAYKLQRKQAFLAMGNLSAAFQRMAQEPKSKQKDYRNLYKYTALNHTFLSSLASLGAFIRTHKTTDASSYFDTYISHITQNLDQAIAVLEQENLPGNNKKLSIAEANKLLEKEEIQLEKKRKAELSAGKKDISLSLRTNMQEIQLISAQLKWLYEVSRNLKKVREPKKSYQ